MRNTPIKPWQKKLWVIYSILYRKLFGLNHPGDQIYNHNPYVSIGKDCAISGTVHFITQNHKPERPKDFQEPKPIVIGNRCWLGANVVILPGVTLGDYTTVGANAVVTKSFPEGRCVLAGIPAKKIRSIKCKGTNED